jgi:hypothetical protein
VLKILCIEFRLAVYCKEYFTTISGEGSPLLTNIPHFAITERLETERRDLFHDLKKAEASAQKMESFCGDLQAQLDKSTRGDVGKVK